MLRRFYIEENIKKSCCHYYNNVYLYHMKGTVNKCQEIVIVTIVCIQENPRT